MPADNKPMSVADYIAAGGCICPFCRSSNIEGGFVEVHAASAAQGCICAECGAAWNDSYKLDGFDVTREPDNGN